MLKSLKTSSCDYRDVEIPDDATVYCDIPYDCTRDTYDDKFDRAAFLDWAAQRKNVYISEYGIDDPRFRCILEMPKQLKSDPKKTRNAVTERIYTTI